VASTVKPVALAAVLCSLLVSLAGCNSGPAYSAQADRTAPTSSAERSHSGSSARSGERKPLGNGLSIAVSAPKSFVPTDSAYPKTPRALGFDVTVENNGPAPYRPTLLAIAASANGVATKQVIDSTQGYTGVVGDDEIPPGGTARFSVAFAVPADRLPVQVSAQHDPSVSAMVIVFDGIA
jgi:hypothetical protein